MKRLHLAVTMLLCSISTIQPMFKRSYVRSFFNHLYVVDESSLGSLKNIVHNKNLCKRAYNVLHHHQGFRSQDELLYRANIQLYDVRILMMKCNQLYRDRGFVCAMAKDSTLQKQVQDLHYELDGERAKLETFILIRKMMQQK